MGTIISRKNYFNIEYHEIRFVETYLINLYDNDKIELNGFGINHLTPLFNYPSFIQHLDALLIGDCIENWLLIKIFIENKANLYAFDITHHHKYFDINSESVLQSLHFIYINNLNEAFEQLNVLESGLDTELGSIILQNLGQILPFKLEYLDLTLVMNNEYKCF
ncbi:hypothetical protein C1646_758858 [Rhizophagus diaphanus]|nr:hypothetical protein C1646_758858 [Rhizophagus diaphanus] [Rhizophagus sp. MUCL 43196]